MHPGIQTRAFHHLGAAKGLFVYVLPLKTIKCMCVYMLSHVRLFAVSWAVAHQAPLSLGFPRPEYQSGLPFPTPGDLSDPEIEPGSLVFPALAGGCFTTALPGNNYFLKSFPEPEECLISQCHLEASNPFILAPDELEVVFESSFPGAVSLLQFSRSLV